MKTETKIFIDAVVKYIVLLICTGYLGIILWQVVVMGKDVNIPELVIVMITLTFNYHFRKAPEKGDNNVKKNTGKTD